MLKLNSFFALILTLLFFNSCALISENSPISIDSKPRGLEIYKTPVYPAVPVEGAQVDQEKIILGRTPFFMKLLPKRNELFSIDYVESDGTQKTRDIIVKQKEDCSVEWTDPLISKIPIVSEVVPYLLEEPSRYIPIMPSLNLISGGRFDCQKSIFFTLPENVVKNPEPLCHRYLLIPPAHLLKNVSDRIMNEWVERIFNKLHQQCDEIIMPNVSDEFLGFYGLDHMNRYSGIKHMPYDVINQLGFRFKATHIVILSYLRKGEEYSVTPEIYDIHSKERINNALESFYSFTYLKSGFFGFQEGLSRTIQLIPNSFTLKINIKKNIKLRSTTSGSNKDYITENSHIDAFPEPHIGSIDYPFRPWTFSLRYSPTLTFNTWHDNFDITVVPLVMAAKSAFHTPFSTLFFRIGWGPAYVNAKSSEGGYNHSVLTSALQVRYGIYYFLTKRIFLMLDKNDFRLPRGTIEHNGFHLKNLSSTRIQLGLYVPEIRTTLTDFIGL